MFSTSPRSGLGRVSILVFVHGIRRDADELAAEPHSPKVPALNLVADELLGTTPTL